MKWIEEANRKQENQKDILSFFEYMEILKNFPQLHLRTTSEYFIDMLEHFGRASDGRFKLFKRAFPDSPPIYGQLKTQKDIYENLKNFTEEGYNNRFILLVGPNGSSKSSIVNKIMKGAEAYSQSEEGALYSFGWVFPIDSFVKGTLGLLGQVADTNLQSYAHLEDKDISAIIPSELKDHPVLLIPKEFRQPLINDYLKDHPTLLDCIKKSYLYHGDVSKKNRMIYDALLNNFKGDHTEVLKHIRVERFRISKRYSNSAVTIEPQLHVDASLQQITMDRRLSSLPPSLQSLNLFSASGEIIFSNRGILEFSDLLKRPMDTFKYLLTTMESRNINIRGILTELDIFFIGTSNEIHLTAFKQHPDFNSFKGRMNFIRVPYLLNSDEETQIYLEQIENIKDKTTFEPLSLDVLCLFTVMTRMRPPQKKNYTDTHLGTLAESLDPIEKTLFLSRKIIPERFNSEDRKTLLLGIDDIRDEYENDNLYEGKFGLSPRGVKQIIYEIAAEYKYTTFYEVIEYLEEFIERKSEYDFLNISPQGDYHHPVRFLLSLKTYALDIFDSQMRDCLGLVDDRSYEEFIGRYIVNINAKLKNEKIQNPFTGKFEEADTHFIEDFEKSLQLKEDPKKFRSHMLTTLGAYSLDHPGLKMVYTEIFPDIIKKLKTTFKEEQKKVVNQISRNLVFYVEEWEKRQAGDEVKNHALNEKGRKEIQEILDKLQKNYHYTEYGALYLLRHLIKERY